jgi:hypothetical protein
MNDMKIQLFENRLIDLLGEKPEVRYRINNCGKDSFFEEEAEQIHALCNEYNLLKKELIIEKKDCDSLDLYTFTMVIKRR